MNMCINITVHQYIITSGSVNYVWVKYKKSPQINSDRTPQYSKDTKVVHQTTKVCQKDNICLTFL
jgi:hypothetical protein